MKHRVDIRYFIIIILAIILAIMCYFYFKEDDTTDISSQKMQIDLEKIDISDETENSSTQSPSQTLVSTTTQVTSALTENIELHATYYLESSLVEEDDTVESGENIIEYTNGTYLTAPYDCVIISLNIPDEEEQCTSQHYVQISSTNLLQVSLSVDESIVNEFSLGQEVEITISALDNKEYTGYITDISNTAQSGKFTITCEFENDGDVLIGMTADVVIKS